MTKKNPKKILMPHDCLGRHEALDRASIAAEMFEEHVYGHPRLKRDERALADKIVTQMWELYQMIGANTYEDEGVMVSPKKGKK